jgi:hypothetical protein
MAFTDLDDFLKTNPNFERKKKLLVLSELVYKPTGEKVFEGFRYFECDIQQLLECFARGDFAAMQALPFATDDDGDPDTSAVRLDVAFTASGSMVAAQPVEYQDYNPTCVADVLFLEGDAAKAVVDAVNELDQTR